MRRSEADYSTWKKGGERGRGREVGGWNQSDHIRNIFLIPTRVGMRNECHLHIRQKRQTRETNLPENRTRGFVSMSEVINLSRSEMFFCATWCFSATTNLTAVVTDQHLGAYLFVIHHCRHDGNHRTEHITSASLALITAPEVRGSGRSHLLPLQPSQVTQTTHSSLLKGDSWGTCLCGPHCTDCYLRH